MCSLNQRCTLQTARQGVLHVCESATEIERLNVEWVFFVVVVVKEGIP